MECCNTIYYVRSWTQITAEKDLIFSGASFESLSILLLPRLQASSFVAWKFDIKSCRLGTPSKMPCRSGLIDRSIKLTPAYPIFRDIHKFYFHRPKSDFSHLARLWSGLHRRLDWIGTLTGRLVRAGVTHGRAATGSSASTYLLYDTYGTSSIQPSLNLLSDGCSILSQLLMLCVMIAPCTFVNLDLGPWRAPSGPIADPETINSKTSKGYSMQQIHPLQFVYPC